MFYDDVESIKELNIETQRSGNKVSSINIMPSHEFIYNNRTTDLAMDKLEQLCSKSALNSTIAKFITNNEYFNGIEFYLPLFYDKLESIFDYVDDSANIHLYGNIHNSIDAFFEESNNRYNDLCSDIDRPILGYDELFIQSNELSKLIKSHKSIKWVSESISKSKTLDVAPISGISANYKLANPFRNMQELITQNNLKKIIFSTDSNGRSQILLEHLNKLQLDIKNIR